MSIHCLLLHGDGEAWLSRCTSDHHRDVHTPEGGGEVSVRWVQWGSNPQLSPLTPKFTVTPFVAMLDVLFME